MSTIPVMINERNAGETARFIKDGAVVGNHSVRRSPSITKIAQAVCLVQAEIKNPAKNKQNPHLKNWYADLGAVLEAVVPVFTRHKLSFIQLPCELDDAPAMMTLLMHESGEWIETVAKIRPTKMDPQGIGSAQTYAKRYALQSIAGIAAEDDDDGNAASRPQERQPLTRPQPAGGGFADADNLPLRARVVAAYAQVKDKAAVTAIDDQVKADRDAGKFSRGDLDAIRDARKETTDRLAAAKA